MADVRATESLLAAVMKRGTKTTLPGLVRWRPLQANSLWGTMDQLVAVQRVVHYSASRLDHYYHPTQSVNHTVLSSTAGVTMKIL